MSKHVLVFTPTYGDGPHPACLAAIDALRFDGQLDKVVSWHNPYPGRDHRNVLAQYERAHSLLMASTADAMLFIEHDNVPPPDALEKLYATPVPVVYGVYVFRHGMLVLNACRYENNSAVGESLTHYPDELRRYRRRGWAKVSGLGFGCTLIRRSVLEQLHFHGCDSTPLPDSPFARDCVQHDIEQIARFDVPVVHIENKRWLKVWEDAMTDMVTVVALQDVTAPTGNGVHALVKGKAYQIAKSEALELDRAGYVRIEREPEPEPKPETVEAIEAPASKRRKKAEN